MDAAGEEFFGFALSQNGFGAGQVGGGVYAQRVLRRAADGGHRDSVPDGEGGEAGQIDFAAVFRRADFREGFFQPLGGGAERAGKGLGDFFVPGAGVALFGDVDDFILRAAQDSPVSARVFGMEYEEGKGAGIADEFSQMRGLQQGRVGAENQDGAVVREMRQGLRGGVSGAAGVFLDGEHRSGGGGFILAQQVGNAGVAGTDDNGDTPGLERADGVQGAEDKRFSGEFRQRLWAVGAKPPTFSGG